jgi:antitoxin HicB
MRSYIYRALCKPGDRRGNIVVTFPDVPEVVTQGRGEADARAMAEEALGLGLLSYLARGKPLPKPRAKGRNLVDIAVAPDVAAKLAVLESFAAAGISKSELARRIGKDEKEVRRILDPKHPTKLPALTAALGALGKRLVVGVMEAEAA